MVLFSCEEDETSKGVHKATNKVDKTCGYQEILNQQHKEDPTLTTRLNSIEGFIDNYVKNNKNHKLVNGKLVIPVQVNVLYNNSEENVSWNQIQSQIDVLNRDFNALNAYYNSVPEFFKSKRANIGITFTLNSTINRKSTTNTTWDEGFTMLRPETGGIAPSDVTQNLNIYVCDIAGFNGFATGPGAGKLDGVVIDYLVFGTTGLAVLGNLGRTSTHEVGHWMGLKHIWGNAQCGDDLVSYTPTHNSPNYGNPTYPHYSTCTGTPIEMTMNYMDYTGNNRYMFSLGQKTRIEAIFVVVELLLEISFFN